MLETIFDYANRQDSVFRDYLQIPSQAEKIAGGIYYLPIRTCKMNEGIAYTPQNRTIFKSEDLTPVCCLIRDFPVNDCAKSIEPWLLMMNPIFYKNYGVDIRVVLDNSNDQTYLFQHPLFFESDPSVFLRKNTNGEFEFHDPGRRKHNKEIYSFPEFCAFVLGGDADGIGRFKNYRFSDLEYKVLFEDLHIWTIKSLQMFELWNNLRTNTVFLPRYIRKVSDMLASLSIKEVRIDRESYLLTEGQKGDIVKYVGDDFRGELNDVIKYLSLLTIIERCERVRLNSEKKKKMYTFKICLNFSTNLEIVKQVFIFAQRVGIKNPSNLSKEIIANKFGDVADMWIDWVFLEGGKIPFSEISMSLSELGWKEHCPK